jgi:hypothetical protein
MNDVSPKDVKRLEILKPITTPNMGQRFKDSLDKEKRLEVASRPIQKTTNPIKQIRNDRESGAMKEPEDVTEESRSKKKRKKNKKKGDCKLGHKHAAGDDMDQEDEVEEGINWSDEE